MSWFFDMTKIEVLSLDPVFSLEVLVWERTEERGFVLCSGS